LTGETGGVAGRDNQRNPVLIFSCLRGQLAASRQQAGHTGGVRVAPADSLVGPFDIAASQPLTDDGLYAGRVIQDRAGEWVLLASRHTDDLNDFHGSLSDPIPLHIAPGERLPSLARPYPTSGVDAGMGGSRTRAH